MATRVVVKMLPGAEHMIVNDPGVAADSRARGERVADEARSTAPVLTGTYRDSIEVQGGDNGATHIGSSVSYAPFVNADTGNLARALDAAG